MGKTYTIDQLKITIDIGWFSAYHTLKGMVLLYGADVIQEALTEIINNIKKEDNQTLDSVTVT